MALIAIGYFGRLFLLDYPNVETLTAVSLLAGILLGGVYAVVVPLAVVALTDSLIGNDIILVYTWSAWLLIGLFGLAARRFGKLHQARFARFIFGTTGLGVASSLFFFLWTNFGVWQLFDYYPSGLNGLLASYLAGLSFLRLSLVGNLFLVPLISGSFVFAWRFLASQQSIAWMRSKMGRADL